MMSTNPPSIFSMIHFCTDMTSLRYYLAKSKTATSIPLRAYMMKMENLDSNNMVGDYASYLDM